MKHKTIVRVLIISVLLTGCSGDNGASDILTKACDQFDSEIKISDKNVSDETINLFHDAAAADPKYKEISQAADKLLGAIVQKRAGITNEVVINSVTENGTVIIRACIENRK